MRYRRLGKTGYQVSEVGFGAWGIGKQMWGGGDDAQAVRALHQAVDRGVNFIDTALVYGSGHSERLISGFLKERSERIYVATKVPPKNFRWPAQGSLEEVFPSRHIVESTHQSLANLGLECIDLMQLHVWDDRWLEQGDWLQTLLKLQEEGKIAHFGVSVNDHSPESAVKLVASGKTATVQVIYNIFDQSPEQELLPLCAGHDVGVIVRVPFDEGALTGAITPETQFPKKDWRNEYFKDDRKEQVHRRVGELSKLLGDEAATLPELALKFCLHNPAVTTVIPGMRRPAHVEANTAVSDHPPLSKGVLGDLRNHAWEKNFYPE